MSLSIKVKFSKSSPTGDDKISHMSDNSSSTPEDFDTSTSPASIQSTNIEKSKSPSKTGAKDKELLSVDEKHDAAKEVKDIKVNEEEVKEVMSSGQKKSKASKGNFKDEIKDIPTARRNSKSNSNNAQGNDKGKEIGNDKLGSRNMYEEARVKLRPTFDRQTSFNRKCSGTGCDGTSMSIDMDEDDENNPVEKLIRQNSVEGAKQTKNANPSSAEGRKREFLVLNYPADIRRNLKGLDASNFEKDENISKSESSTTASKVNNGHNAKMESSKSIPIVKNSAKSQKSDNTPQESIKRGSPGKSLPSCFGFRFELILVIIKARTSFQIPLIWS